MKNIKHQDHDKQLIIRTISPELTQSVLVPKKESGKPWGLLTARTFSSSSEENALEFLNSPGDGEERRIVVTLQATDAESVAKHFQRISYNVNDIIYDVEFGKGLMIAPNSQESIDQSND